MKIVRCLITSSFAILSPVRSASYSASLLVVGKSNCKAYSTTPLGQASINPVPNLEELDEPSTCPLLFWVYPGTCPLLHPVFLQNCELQNKIYQHLGFDQGPQMEFHIKFRELKHLLGYPPRGIRPMEDHLHGLVNEKGDAMGLKYGQIFLAEMIRTKMSFFILVYLVSASWKTLLM